MPVLHSSSLVSTAVPFQQICNGPGFQLLLLNSRSFCNKASFISDLMKRGGLTCITISGTGDCSFGDMPSWVWHSPRLQGRGGVVVVVMQDSLRTFWNAAPPVPKCEVLFIKLVFKDQLEFLLLYNPLCCIATSLSELHFSVGSEVPQTWFWGALICLLWKWGLNCLESSWPS